MGVCVCLLPCVRICQDCNYLYLYPHKTNDLWGILESACLSILPCVSVSAFVQNTNFCQSAGGGFKSHLVTALVLYGFQKSLEQLFSI